MSCLLSSIKKSILGTITSSATSLEPWAALEGTFSSLTNAGTLQLKMQLQNDNKVLSLSLTTTNMKMLADSQIAAGNRTTDEELILYLNGGVEPEYDSLVVNTTGRTTMPSLEEVYFLLLTHESRTGSTQQGPLISQVMVPPMLDSFKEETTSALVEDGAMATRAIKEAEDKESPKVAETIPNRHVKQERIQKIYFIFQKFQI